VLKANEVLGYDIPPGTIRSAMKPLSALFLFKLETNKHQEIVSKFEKNSSRGRKAVSYQARPLNDIQSSLIDWVAPRIYETEHPVLDNPILARPTARMMEALNVDNATRIAQELDERYRPAYQHQRHRERFAEQRAQRNLQRLIEGLDNWYSTPLPPGWPVSNASNYRVAFLRALTQAQPDRPFSRRELQAVLGIANGSIKSMVKRAGLEAEPQFQEHSAPVTGDIAKAVMQMGRDQQGYPRDLIIRSSNDQDIVLPYDVRSAPGIIKQQAANGASVAIKFQTPNTYRTVRNTPQPAIKPPARSTGVHRPSTTHSAQKLTTGRYFGPNYDVRWVKGQLEVAFVKLGWHSNDQLVNPHTGELLDDRQVHTLLEILLGRSATSETVALPHRQRRPFDPTPEEEAEMWKRIELLRMFVR